MSTSYIFSYCTTSTNHTAYLSAQYFQLTTLFVDETLDLLRIVNAHPSLKMLGAYQKSPWTGLGRLLPLCSLSGRHLIAMGLSVHNNTTSGYNDVYIIPELLNFELAQKFGEFVLRAQDFESFLVFNAEYVSWLTVYLRSVPPQESFCAFMESAAEVFKGTMGQPPGDTLRDVAGRPR